MRGRVGAPRDPLYYNTDRDADLVVQAEAFTGEPYARTDHPRVLLCKFCVKRSWAYHNKLWYTQGELTCILHKILLTKSSSCGILYTDKRKG